MVKSNVLLKTRQSVTKTRFSTNKRFILTSVRLEHSEIERTQKEAKVA